mmetsp:Transcript_27668/g.79764  ORF Transcript_27668/g.79764 Transcript_27668/m.79764 type:complete len:208 (-) Transcript_27668:578-1201(-)
MQWLTRHPLTSSAWKHGARCTSIGCTLCPVQTPGSATTAKSLVQQPMNDTAVVLARTSMPALHAGGSGTTTSSNWLRWRMAAGSAMCAGRSTTATGFAATAARTTTCAARAPRAAPGRPRCRRRPATGATGCSWSASGATPRASRGTPATSASAAWRRAPLPGAPRATTTCARPARASRPPPRRSAPRSRRTRRRTPKPRSRRARSA